MDPIARVRFVGRCVPIALAVWAASAAPASGTEPQASDPAAGALPGGSIVIRQGEQGEGTSLLDLDIEQLGQIDVVVPSFDVQVTSVMRSESTVGRSPAAVFVITNDMIRRSGATSIAEALRLAPGLHVARTDSHKWAISSRGFNSRFANKLLVMIDGRSVYNPLFGGVFWEVQDYPLEDIDRIEVIRGPGATVWGENAVNGVINIITKPASVTQGTLVSTTVGDVNEAINSVRYGFQTEGGGHLRVYTRQREQDHFAGGQDDWRFAQGGFRYDLPLDRCGTEVFMLQGNAFEGTFGETGLFATPSVPFTRPFVTDSRMWGGNVLGRWSRTAADGEFYVQAYYDRIGRDSEDVQLEQDTFDLEFQHRHAFLPGHVLAWGANVRHVRDVIDPLDFVLDISPRNIDFTRSSVFIQDEISLADDRAVMFVGSKFSWNDFTGFEVQPGIRGLWMPDPRQAVWAAVSRAVRLPSRAEDGITLNFFEPTIPAIGSYRGSGSLEAEELTAFELGYRAQPDEAFSWDIVAFVHQYNDLMGFRSGSVQLGFPPTFMLDYYNGLDAESYGAELTATYQVNDCWRLQGWYSFLELFIHGGGDELGDGSAPRNQAFLMSSWDLTSQLQLDLIARYVDDLPTLNVREYVSLDARLGYRPSDEWEFALVGQNLLDRQHREFREDLLTESSEVPRGVYFQAVWQR